MKTHHQVPQKNLRPKLRRARSSWWAIEREKQPAVCDIAFVPSPLLFVHLSLSADGANAGGPRGREKASFAWRVTAWGGRAVR